MYIYMLFRPPNNPDLNNAIAMQTTMLVAIVLIVLGLESSFHVRLAV